MFSAVMSSDLDACVDSKDLARSLIAHPFVPRCFLIVTFLIHTAFYILAVLLAERSSYSSSTVFSELCSCR
jgi:hypothetical protein